MKQFYELYRDNEKVSTLLTQLSWSNHLKIMSACKTMEERIFYMNMCVKEKYSARELARQIDSGFYERYMISRKPLTPAIEESRRATGNVFLDNYVLDFLDVPDSASERDLRKSIIRNLKDFILEIGKDFTFVVEEYRVQVGIHDYYIDLLLYHRGLSCLAAFELKKCSNPYCDICYNGQTVARVCLMSYRYDIDDLSNDSVYCADCITRIHNHLEDHH